MFLLVLQVKEQVRESADDSLLGVGLAAVLTVSAGMTILCWLATLRGAWLLGAGDRRSAVLAWLAGLWGTVRQPVSSLFTLAVWGLPAISATVIPLAAGWRFADLQRNGPDGHRRGRGGADDCFLPGRASSSPSPR